MQTADFNHQDFDPSSRQSQDEQLLVKFFVKPREDAKASKEEGRPIFKDVEYIDIKIAGNRAGGACRPASFEDKQRFPRHYAAFKQRTEVPTEGTPLIEWSLISRSQAEELSFYHVKTVEALATLNDNAASKFMGLNGLKAKAKAWLEHAKESAGEEKLHEELGKRDETIELLQKQMAEMQAKFDSLPVAETEKMVVETTEDLSAGLDTPEPEEIVEPEAKAPAKKRTRRRRTES